MKISQYSSIVLLVLLFSSCTNIAVNIGWVGLIILFAVLMSLFIVMFVLIIRRRKQADKSLVQFSAKVQQMLEKYDNPQSKINTLEILIGRISDDEKYTKDPVWRDQVLAKTYLHLATQYNSIGDMKNTLDACSKILELTPDDAMTLYNRGSIYSNIGNYEKALIDLNKSIDLVDDYASSYNNRGMIFTKLKQYENAFDDFNRALQLEESSIIYYNRGNMSKEQNNIDGALSDFQKALGLCSEYDEELKIEIESIIKSLSSKDI